MLLILSAASAGATTITIMPATSISNAYADESAWVLSTFGSNFVPDTLENFNEFTASDTSGYTSLSTNVGTFSVMPGSQPGNPTWSSGTKQNQFTILDSADTPFKGRFNTTPGGGNWLDTNDITGIQLSTSLDTLIFMVTDVNDIRPGDTVSIKTADGTESSAFAPEPPAQNGNLYFVAITSSGPIGDVWFLNTSTADGYGLDDFGTVVDPPAPTPEPGTLGIAGIGLAAIIWGRKRQISRSAAGV